MTAKPRRDRLEERLRRDAAEGWLALAESFAGRPVAKLRAGKPLNRADRAAIVDLLDALDRLRAVLVSQSSEYRPRKTGRPRTADGIGDLIESLMTKYGWTRPAAIRAVDPRAKGRHSLEYGRLAAVHARFLARGGRVDPRRATAALDRLRGPKAK